jgi:hypothetical protein
VVDAETIIATDESGCRHQVRGSVDNGEVVLELALLVPPPDGALASATWRVVLTSTSGSEEVQFDSTSSSAGLGRRLVSTSEVTAPDRRSRRLTMALLPPRRGEYSADSTWAGGTAALRFALDATGGVSAAGSS